MPTQNGPSTSTKPCIFPRAVIRTDGSARLGGGHVVRTQALSAALQSRGWMCSFAVGRTTLETFPQLTQQYDCIRLDGAADDEPRHLREYHNDPVRLLVVDHPERDSAFEAACRPWAGQILSIDGTLRRHDCDLLIDPLPGREPAHHEGLVSPGCVLLLGPQYTPLRSSFALCRKASLARRTRFCPVGQVVVVAGATGAANHVLDLLSALDDSNLPDTVKVVVPAAHGREAVERFASRARLSVDVRGWVENPAVLFSESDMAVACGGSACWELCALGIPCVVVAVATNQRLVVDSLERHGAAIVASRRDGVDHDEVVAAINRLTSDPALYRNVSRAAARLCDGRGAERVARIVSERVATC